MPPALTCPGAQALRVDGRGDAALALGLELLQSLLDGLLHRAALVLHHHFHHLSD